MFLVLGRSVILWFFGVEYDWVQVVWDTLVFNNGFLRWGLCCWFFLLGAIFVFFWSFCGCG